MRLLLAQLNPTIGDFKGNCQKILAALEHARKSSCELVLLSELVLTGYPPEDLLLLPDFVDACEQALQQVVQASRGLVIIVGTVRRNPTHGEKPLHNSAAIIEDGKLLGFQDKRLLPTYDVFDERRYFEPATETKIWKLRGKNIAITTCEDIWRPSDPTVLADYGQDPIEELIPLRPDLLLNLSASPYSYNKPNIRQDVVCRAAKRLKCPSILCNQVGANDSLIFDGNSIVANSKGEVCIQAKSFHEDIVVVETDALPAPHTTQREPTADLYQALVLGLRDYFQKSGFKKACLGLSGGIDSALVACIAVDALGRENVLNLAMPSRYTSQESVVDAEQLAKNLGTQLWTLPIEEPFKAYLTLLEPHFLGKVADVTEENLQSRIRGMILMAISNKHGYIVLATGNKSEMAMGYATLYGDMCGGLSVINDLTKEQVYQLSRYVNRERTVIPDRILTKAPSAELKPNQRDTDTLPEYSIVDAVLEDYVEYHLPLEAIVAKRKLPRETVQELIWRIHRNEYKRRQAPPGLRVSEKAFSVGRRFPIVQRWR